MSVEHWGDWSPGTSDTRLGGQYSGKVGSCRFEVGMAAPPLGGCESREVPWAWAIRGDRRAGEVVVAVRRPRWATAAARRRGPEPPRTGIRRSCPELMARAAGPLTVQSWPSASHIESTPSELAAEEGSARRRSQRGRTARRPPAGTEQSRRSKSNGGPEHPPGVLRGARSDRRLARRPAARGCKPSPPTSPRSAPGRRAPGERLDGSGRGPLPGRPRRRAESGRGHRPRCRGRGGESDQVPRSTR